MLVVSKDVAGYSAFLASYPDAKSEKNLNLDNQGYVKLIHFIDGKITKENLEIK